MAEIPVTQTLYYQNGSSDKVYQVELKQDPKGWLVTFAYGRRGGPLKDGLKTKEPVTYDKAMKIYDKLIQGKTSKGYSPGESGTRFLGTELADRATEYQPQLLNPIEDPQALLENETHWAQEKHDGKRVMIQKKGEEIIGINRRGLTIGIPEPIHQEIQTLPEDIVLDGELIGTRYVVFDIVDETAPYAERLTLLENLSLTTCEIVETHKSPEAKQTLFQAMKTQKREGVVFKDPTTTYTPGRPASGGPQLKYKFYATATCQVAKQNEGKRSVALQLWENETAIPVGNVTIPQNQEMPAEGALVEIRYLYAYPEGSLYQPTYLGERDDLLVDACTRQQLKYKSQD